MTVMLAVLPLLLVIGALVARQSTLRAAVLGLVSAVVIAATRFELTWRDVATQAGQWSPLVIEVMLIIAGGIAFAEAGRRAGDQDTLSGWLRRHLGAGVAPVLAVVHGVTPLAESLTGFGIGVAIAVPLLIGLGYPGRQAAPLALLGLCAVPWGSMGPGTLIAAQSSGATFHELGVASAVFSVPVFLGVGIAAERGRRLVGVGLAVLSGLVLWGSIWIANLIFGTAPAGALGAAVTLGLHLLFHRLRGSRMSGSRAELRAIAPYGLLLGGVLLASVILRGTDVDDTAWRYLASPALWLAVATVFTLRGRRGQLPGALRQAAGAWIHVGPATALFILLGAVMSVSGMSGQLATALAGIGGFYLFLVPFIGGTGGFITGSNSGANAMFAGPQAQAAQTLGASVLSVSAVQNVSASALTLAAPARIELAVRLCPDQPPRQPVFRQILTTSAGILLVLATLTVVSG